LSNRGVVFTKSPDENALREAVPLGLAARLLCNAGRGRLSLQSFLAWLQTPVRLGQCAFLMSEASQPLGMAIWAYVAQDTFDRLKVGDVDLLLFEEWNEGQIIWVVDVLAPYGHLLALIRSLKAIAPHEQSEAFYFRRGLQRVTL
jgi:cytolysin-activating lysine-acyltransferase